MCNLAASIEKWMVRRIDLWRLLRYFCVDDLRWDDSHFVGTFSVGGCHLVLGSFSAWRKDLVAHLLLPPAPRYFHLHSDISRKGNLKRQKKLNTSLFSCPGQLNRWPCQSLSDSSFDFSIFRALQSCRWQRQWQWQWQRDIETESQMDRETETAF